MILRRLMLAVCAAVLLSGVFSGTAFNGAALAAPAKKAVKAPETAPVIGDVKTGDLQALIDTLDNDDKRKAFVATLKTAVAVRKAEEERHPGDGAIALSLVTQVALLANQAGQQIMTGFGLAEEVPVIAQEFEDAATDPDSRSALGIGLLKLLCVLSGSLAAMLIAQIGLRRVRGHLRVPEAAVEHPVERVMVPLLLLGLDIVPTVALAAVGALLLSVVGGGDDMASSVQALDLGTGGIREAVGTVLGMLISMQLMLSMSTTLFTPARADQRILPIRPENGMYLSLWLRRLASTMILGHFFVEVMLLIGLSDEGALVLRKMIGLIFSVFLVVFLLQNRRVVGDWIRFRLPKRMHGRQRVAMDVLRDHVASLWHVLALAYVTAAYVVWAAEIPDGFLYMVRSSVWTAVVVVGAVAIVFGVRIGLGHTFALSVEQRRRFPKLEERANRYLPIFDGILRWGLTSATAVAILEAWGLDVQSWLGSGIGLQLSRAGGTILTSLLLAFLIWVLVTAWMDRYLTEVDNDGRVIQRSARAKTLLPLLRNLLFVALVVVDGMVILDAIGVNIAPLLAGAGVIGLALGFGSQKLVQDVITGAFILFEDTVAVGDVADISGHVGVVESLSIRSLRLRDGSGAVHTVPFSSVTTIINLTKGHSYAVLDLRVRHTEDTDRVTEIMRQVGDELYQDPAFEYSILEHIEMQGLDVFSDTAVKVLARIRTRAGHQWSVQREFNRRIKKAMEGAGIPLSIPSLNASVDPKPEIKKPAALRPEVLVPTPAADDDNLP